MPIESPDYDDQKTAGVVNVLHQVFGAEWGSIEYWQWKHFKRPGFSNSNVKIVVADGQVVACFHMAIQTLRLAPGIELPCSWEGDFAILKEHRGKGLLE